jgi:hypothetical protein
VKRIFVVLSSVTALIALSVTLGGAAWTATAAATTPAITQATTQVSDPPTTAVIIFDDAAQQAELIIPTPACPTSQPDCQWKFFLNEPKLHVDVATVYGTSGTLTIPYPENFCGVIQADAYVGPPWVAKRGFQHTIDNCEPPTTTTTTTTTKPITPIVTPTTEPPTPTTGAPIPPTPPAAPHVAPPVPAVPVATPVAAPTTPAPAPTQLPFTGVDTKPLLAIGLLLVMLGLVLLNSTASWRRLARRLLATVHSG